jgi:Domain of unknown function (DUF4253)
MAKSGKPDFSKAAKSTEYQAAVAELEKLAGSSRRVMKDVKGGFAFRVKKKPFKLDKIHTDFLDRGCHVFGTDAIEKDRIAILPTADKYDVLFAMETSAPNHNRDTKKIVAWLRKLEKTQPFIITGASYEHVSGRFTTKVKDVEDIALRILDFSPDLDNFDELLTRLPKTGDFMLWWT